MYKLAEQVKVKVKTINMCICILVLIYLSLVHSKSHMTSCFSVAYAVLACLLFWDGGVGHFIFMIHVVQLGAPCRVVCLMTDYYVNL